MSLQFIGDAGVYFPERDSVKINAIAGDSIVECFVTRSALAAIGCKPSDDAKSIVRQFENHRLDCELAALAKLRRSRTKLLTVDITAGDLAPLEKPHAA